MRSYRRAGSPRSAAAGRGCRASRSDPPRCPVRTAARRRSASLADRHRDCAPFADIGDEAAVWQVTDGAVERVRLSGRGVGRQQRPTTSATVASTSVSMPCSVGCIRSAWISCGLSYRSSSRKNGTSSAPYSSASRGYSPSNCAHEIRAPDWAVRACPSAAPECRAFSVRPASQPDWPAFRPATIGAADRCRPVPGSPVRAVDPARRA